MLRSSLLVACAAEPGVVATHTVSSSEFRVPSFGGTFVVDLLKSKPGPRNPELETRNLYPVATAQGSEVPTKLATRRLARYNSRDQSSPLTVISFKCLRFSTPVH